MSPAKLLEQLAQDVNLTIKNRFFDDIDGDDGKTYILQIYRWAAMWLDELEYAVDPSGKPINWWFSRANDATLGTATAGSTSISVPRTMQRLLTEEERYVQIKQDSTVISNWVVVAPENISSTTDRITRDMCAQVGDTIVFSRPFRDTENNGTITGDIQTKIERPSATNAKVITTVQPYSLLVLGVAKNATLPDTVRGGLSPSYAQKYNDLLNGAIARSMATGISRKAVRQQFGNVQGV